MDHPAIGNQALESRVEQPIRIAAAQFPVSADLDANLRYIKKQVIAAATQGATVVHFPETALSGYPPAHWTPAGKFSWETLNDHTEQVCELAAQHSLWVVLGSIRQVNNARPRNCLQVISHCGEIAATYDKQRLYGREKRFFSQGHSPTIVDIHGHRCGFLVCYDNCFPELYEPYREAGVGLLFHSFHNAANSHPTPIKDLMMANLLVRAADNQMWIVASNSSQRYSPLAACVVRPDGSARNARRHVAGLVVDDYPRDDLAWTYDNRSY